MNATDSRDRQPGAALPRVTVARDASIVALTVAAWTLDTALAGRAGREVPVLGVVTGLATALVGFLAHEWGHLAGALLAGSRVHFPNRLTAPLLFHFDVEHNDRRRFLAMSYGGFAASALALIVMVALFPADRVAGRTALVLAGVGTVVSLVAEVPTAIRVARGAPLPTGYAFTPPR